jgi:hypothetical protein
LGDGEAELGMEGNAGFKIETARKIFNEVVRLKVGETATSAAVNLDGGDLRLQKLGAGFLTIRVRSRLTADRGKCVMAS